MVIFDRKAFIGVLILLILTAACNIANKRQVCKLPDDGIEYSWEIEEGYIVYNDLELAQKCSQKTGKPILLLFTCWACLSNSDLPYQILREEDVKKIIEENFILVALNVDEEKPLAVIDTSQKNWKGQVMKTVGDKHINFQITQFQSNYQPLYTLVNHDLSQITEPIGYTPIKNKMTFIAFLKKGIK